MCPQLVRPAACPFLRYIDCFIVSLFLSVLAYFFYIARRSMRMSILFHFGTQRFRLYDWITLDKIRSSRRLIGDTNTQENGRS